MPFLTEHEQARARGMNLAVLSHARRSYATQEFFIGKFPPGAALVVQVITPAVGVHSLCAQVAYNKVLVQS